MRRRYSVFWLETLRQPGSAFRSIALGYSARLPFSGDKVALFLIILLLSNPIPECTFDLCATEYLSSCLGFAMPAESELPNRMLPSDIFKYGAASSSAYLLNMRQLKSKPIDIREDRRCAVV